MSEHTPSESNYDDAFEEMMRQFEDDEVYVEQIGGLNEKLGERALFDMFTLEDPFDIDRGPYYLESVTEPLQQLVDSFYGYCDDLGVDITNEDTSPEDLERLSEFVAVETYQMRKQIAPGDIVSAKNGIIIDINDDFTALELADGIRVQGEVVGTLIGTLPDDVAAITQDEELPAPLGVGLMLKDVVFVETAGSGEGFDMKDSMVILALGTLGLSVDKHIYQSDAVFTTEDDEPLSGI